MRGELQVVQALLRLEGVRRLGHLLGLVELALLVELHHLAQTERVRLALVLHLLREVVHEVVERSALLHELEGGGAHGVVCLDLLRLLLRLVALRLVGLEEYLLYVLLVKPLEERGDEWLVSNCEAEEVRLEGRLEELALRHVAEV